MYKKVFFYQRPNVNCFRKIFGMKKPLNSKNKTTVKVYKWFVYYL